MSVVSHLEVRGRGMRTPVDVGADVGLVTDGAVLRGEQSAVGRIATDGILGNLQDEWAPRRRYSSVVDYDPVLASHCRLDGQ